MSHALEFELKYSEPTSHALGITAVQGVTPPTALSHYSALVEHGSTQDALDAKTKELIALAITVADRCDGCIVAHTRDALKTGASRREITDALGVAVLMGGSPSMFYARRVIDALERFQNQA